MSQISSKGTGGGGGGSVNTLTGNIGVATAASNNINVVGGSNISTTGVGDTLTVDVSGTTDHAVQVGSVAGSLNSLALGTAGQVLTSNGPGVDPSFQSLTSPLPIANGGTNATSMANTYGVNYFDGTRLVTTAVGTAGQVLTSNGAGVAPTFQAGGGGGGITTIDLDNSSSVTGSTIGLSESDTGNQTGTIYTSAGSATQINLNYFDQYNSLVMGTQFSYTTFGGNSSFVDTVAIGANILVDAVSIAGTNSNNYNENCLIGSNVLSGIGLGTPIGGNFNCAIGYNALNQLGQFAFAPGNANYNCVMGWSAGTNYTAAESNNILLNSPGVAAENNVLHIGAGTGTGSQELAAAYISGIRGVGIVGTAVLVSASDQLGIAVSSKRFKKNIDDMGNYSEDIHKLRPVTFDYKDQSFDDPMVGLIAEEVEEVMPELVVKDKEGLPLTVKYLDLIPMLLNEVQKLRKELNALKS